ncbi:hypothetical protein LBMAG47_24570 [Planctomycetia bacterium]|nr:hypothetical protein LBMAG47_24570 [Planctomycetia bacterium]
MRRSGAERQLVGGGRVVVRLWSRRAEAGPRLGGWLVLGNVEEQVLLRGKLGERRRERLPCQGLCLSFFSSSLAAWLEENVPEVLTGLRVPATHRRRLRTTNGLERLNKEIKRRTRVATLFPNEAPLLRLASAVLSEISDDWETERAYLTMEAR